MQRLQISILRFQELMDQIRKFIKLIMLYQMDFMIFKSDEMPNEEIWSELRRLRLKAMSLAFMLFMIVETVAGALGVVQPYLGRPVITDFDEDGSPSPERDPARWGSRVFEKGYILRGSSKNNSSELFKAQKACVIAMRMEATE